MSTRSQILSHLLRSKEGHPLYEGTFHYRSVIGKLNYLEKCTRPDITYAVHQCVRFCKNSNITTFKAIEHIVKYLRKTKDKCVILTPNRIKSLEFYADANFSGNWYKSTVADNASIAKTRSGFIISYAGCFTVWSSKLQT